METNKMEIFLTVKKNLASLAFVPNQRPFYTNQLIHTSYGFLAIILQCLYLFFDAETIKEYMDSIFMTTVGILVYVGYLSMVFKMVTIFIFIDDMEQVVNRRKFNDALKFNVNMPFFLKKKTL